MVGAKAAQVATGFVHTVICTAEGRVWTFGDGVFGRLGHGGTAYVWDDASNVEGLAGVNVAQVA